MDNEMRPPQPKRPLALPLGARSTQFGHLSQGSTSSSAPVSASSSGNGTSPPADFASSLESAAVWQCAACRQVLADSNSFVCNIPQLKLIVVSDAPSVQRNGDVSVSQVGIDKGSSFNLVSCARCGTPVGRTYLTTSGQLDAARGAIALLASNVTMYKLGAGPDVDTMAEHAGIASHMARLQVTESNVVGLRETCDFLAEQVAKLQTVVLLLHEQQEAPHQGVTSAVSSKSSSSRGSGDSRDRAAASSPADTPPKSSKRKGTKRPRERGGASATKGVSSHQGKRSMSSAPSPAAASGGGMTSLSALASPGGAGGSKHSSGGSGSALASFLSSPRGLAALNSPPPAPPASKSGSSKKGKRRIAPQLVSPV